jgi:hypothetical protein
MNIFVTHHNPEIAAKHLCDKHVPKMILESAQMLSNAFHVLGLPHLAPYRQLMLKHPCCKWVLESRGNFEWLLRHAKQIAEEFEQRFGKKHKCEDVILSMERNYMNLSWPKKSRTKFVQCMPRIYRNRDVIVAYRSYIKHAKMFAKWKKGRKKPSWFLKHYIEFNHEEIGNYMTESIPLPDSVPQHHIDFSATIAWAKWSVEQENANLM